MEFLIGLNLFKRTFFLFTAVIVVQSGCTQVVERDKVAGAKMASHTEPVTKDPNKELERVGKDWLYGPGFGRSVLNIGTVVIFPPYAVYLLGNALLDAGGYQQLHVTDALPDAPREGVLSVYNGVTSVPGRAAAGIAGEEYKVELEKAQEKKAQENGKNGS